MKSEGDTRLKKIPFVTGCILLIVFFLSSLFWGGNQDFVDYSLWGAECLVVVIASFFVTAISFWVRYGLKKRTMGWFPSFAGLFRADRPVWWMGVFGYSLLAALVGLVGRDLFFFVDEGSKESLPINALISFIFGWACACFLGAFIVRKKCNKKADS